MRSRTQLGDAALLLVPGLVTAAGFMWLGSGRAAGVDTDDSLRFLLFVPLQTLGLTIAKFGMDAWTLSRASEWTGRMLQLRWFACTHVIPAAAIVSGLVWWRFGFVSMVVAFISIVFDVIALIRSSELAAQGRARSAAVAHLFREPLFFAMLLVSGLIETVHGNTLLILFAASSVFRVLILSLRDTGAAAASVAWPHTGRLATQQIFNYGLFKNDQLLMGLLQPTGGLDRAFVYLARFPELVSAAVTAVSPALFPAAYERNELTCRNRLSIALCVSYALVLVAGAIIYSVIAPATVNADPWWIAAIVTHALLVVPANYRTYALLRTGDERVLVVSLFKANAIGIAFASLLLMLPIQNTALLWVIPLQQLIFLSTSKVGTPHG